MIVAQRIQPPLHRRHMAIAVARAQGSEGAVQKAVGAALDNHLGTVWRKAVKLLGILYKHADTSVGRIAADGTGLIGAMDAKLAPGHVQPKKRVPNPPKSPEKRLLMEKVPIGEGVSPVPVAMV